MCVLLCCCIGSFYAFNLSSIYLCSMDGWMDGWMNESIKFCMNKSNQIEYINYNNTTV